MPTCPKVLTIGVVLSAALAVQGCLTTPGNPHGTVSGVRSVQPGTEQIEFNVPEFQGGLVTRVKYEEPYSREEYALFEGNGAQAEIIFIQTLGFEEVVLEFSKRTREAASTFNFVQNSAVTFGPSAYQALGTPLPTYVHPFTAAQTSQNCFGFQSQWDFEPEDNEGRYRRVMFGYYCAAPGQSLSQQDTDKIAGSIALNGITTPAERPVEVAEGPAHEPALQILVNQGKNPSTTGNSDFPFKPLAFYQTWGSDSFD